VVQLLVLTFLFNVVVFDVMDFINGFLKEDTALFANPVFGNNLMTFGAIQYNIS
jgi:hypothetical protein